jgi:hypothetical protein
MGVEEKKERQKRKKKAKDVRRGIRLNTPAPKIITPKKSYTRKKRKEAIREDMDL